MTTPFHLGWFNDGFRTPAWRQEWAGTSSTDWTTGEFFVDMARTLERACFDFVLFADVAFVPNVHGGSSEAYLRQAQESPRLDPTVIAPLMAAATRHLGIVPTLSVTEWAPYQLARYFSALDHVSGGRAGWNIVTGGNPLSAANFGKDVLPHDERYVLAHEFAEVTQRLWASWEPDAIVADLETGYYADHTKVHPIDHQGKYFSVRGPLNAPPSPQGRPVMLQAGSSPAGRDFAASHADIIACAATSVGAMKTYREDIRSRATAAGRNPDDIKLMFLVEPTVASTDAEAHERVRRYREESQDRFDLRLASASSHMSIDLAQFDLDQPIPDDAETEGHQSELAAMRASGLTLREIMGGAATHSSPLVGSPVTVAATMGEWMEEVGGDGFLILDLYLTRRYLAEICDGLVPELQRRGLTRTDYPHAHFGDNMRAF